MTSSHVMALFHSRGGCVSGVYLVHTFRVYISENPADDGMWTACGIDLWDDGDGYQRVDGPPTCLRCIGEKHPW